MSARRTIFMKAAIPLAVSAFLAAVFVSCGDSDPGVTYPFRIAISGLDQQDGVFDAAPAEDGTGRIWMSFSQVSLPQAGFRWVSTRVAYSDDRGLTWADVGVFNPATAETTKPAGETRDLVWEHEVSRLVYDPYDVPASRWKVLWHRYLSASDSGNTIPLFQYGWIELKTAPSANGPWTTGTKLFGGSLYYNASFKPYNDSVPPINPPLQQLDTLDSALNGCLVFTEPGIVATQDWLYVSLKCAKDINVPGKIVLLKCDHDFSPCTYLADLIGDTEASNYGDYSGFSASELVQSGGQTYLLATPTKDDAYRGCLVFTIENLTTPTPSLKQTGVVPDVKLSVSGSAGSFNGACGYTAGLTQSGIVYSEFFPGQTPEFRLFGSGQNL